MENPEVTRYTIIRLLEVNDHIFSSTSRFRIIDVYDLVVTEKQTQEKVENLTNAHIDLKIAA